MKESIHKKTYLCCLFLVASLPLHLCALTTYTDIDLNSFPTTATPGFKIFGAAANDQSGFCVNGELDFNKDGRSDLLVGAWNSAPSGRTGAGTSYLILTNSTDNFPNIDLSTRTSGPSTGFKMFGENYVSTDHNTVSSGFSLSAIGDVNGDTWPDFIVGSYGADVLPTYGAYDSGKAYVLFGGSAASHYNDIDFLNFPTGPSVGFTLISSFTDENVGYSVSGAGDFNNDGVDDFLIGAFGYSGQTGTTYFVYGQSSWTTSVSNINLRTWATNNAAITGVMFMIFGSAGSDQAGRCVSGAGDVNNDGFDDIIIGSGTYDPNGLTNAGLAAVIFGRSSAMAHQTITGYTAGATTGFRVLGYVALDRLGSAVSNAGDYNHDGYADIVIGAQLANSEAGAVYVIFGHGGAFSDIDMASFTSGSTGFIVNGAAAGDRLGSFVGGAGDFNADGFDDIVIGANQASPSSRSGAGAVYILFGKASGFGTINLASFSSGPTGVKILGATAGDHLGVSVSGAGDVNADGVSDIIIGANFASPSSRSSAGTSYVVFGIATIAPTMKPSAAPTAAPSRPTAPPTIVPSARPSARPTSQPSSQPSRQPSGQPSRQPTSQPSRQPTAQPSHQPSVGTVTMGKHTASSTYTLKNGYAFAVLDAQGRVHAFGEGPYGGNSSAHSAGALTSVSKVVPSLYAFAAVKSTGGLAAWGVSTAIAGAISSGVTSVVANEAAFAGITSANAAFAFGSVHHGGVLSSTEWCAGCSAQLAANVRSITASSGAFAAIKTDGSVFAWGSKHTGGGVSTATMPELINVVSVVATRAAFAALLAPGRVVTWGEALSGGDSSSVAALLRADIVHLVASRSVFVAFQKDSGIVVWGHPMYGGDTTQVAASLSHGVASVYHTYTAMAALKTDGTVVTWGKADSGGDSSTAQSQLVSVSKIYANSKAFAAVTSAGKVVTWGRAADGGQIPAGKVSALSSGVVAVYGTDRAFVARKSDGSVVVWGNTAYGGAPPTAVSTLLTSQVHTVCSNAVAFLAIRTTGQVVSWGHETASPVQGVIVQDDGLMVAATCA